jgi:UDP-GlcNAc:undecaprenyl-phosphate GlcNAc-1-phosphate transferase
MLFFWDMVCVFVSMIVINQGVKYAKVWRLLDNPSCERKKHTAPTPMVGGLALFSALTLSCAYSYFSNAQVPVSFMLSVSVIFIIGIIDDIQGVGAYKRLLIQISVAFYLLVNDPQLYLGVVSFIPFEHTVFKYTIEIVTAFFIVGSINAFNLVDGVDGLAGSLALVSMLAIAYLSYGSMPVIFLMAIFLSISISVYLGFNLEFFGPSKKIFLGDSGSTVLGLTLSWMALKLVGNTHVNVSPVSGLFLMLVPLLDTILVIGRRLSLGKSPFSPDRMHMHHMLVDVGFSKEKTVLILGCISLLFAALAIFQLSMILHIFALVLLLGIYSMVLLTLSPKTKFVLFNKKKLGRVDSSF